MGQSGSGGGDTREVAVSLQIDQQEAQQRQQQLQQEAQEGNFSQEELEEEQEAIQELQQEAVDEAIATAEEEFESGDIEVEDQIDSQGLMLISGADSAILDTLDSGAVQAIAPADIFDEISQQQEQSAEMTESTDE